MYGLQDCDKTKILPVTEFGANFDEFELVGFDHSKVDDRDNNCHAIESENFDGAGRGTLASADYGSGQPLSSLSNPYDLRGYQINSRGFCPTRLKRKNIIDEEGKMATHHKMLNRIYHEIDRKLFERQGVLFHGRETFVCPAITFFGRTIAPEDEDKNRLYKNIEEKPEDDTIQYEGLEEENSSLYLFYHDDRDGVEFRGWWVTGETLNNREKPVLFSPSDVATPDQATGWVSYPGHENIYDIHPGHELYAPTVRI